MENLRECASLVGQYKAYLAKLLVESNGARLSSDSAITAHSSHVHVAADPVTVTQSHYLQTVPSHSANTT